MKSVKALFFLSLFMGSYLLGVEYKEKSSSLRDTIVYVAKNTAAIGACLYLPTLFHELGHALTAKLLFGFPIDISLFGNYRTSHTKPLFALGGIRLISLVSSRGSDSFFPHASYDDYWKNLAVLASGPVWGMLSTIGLAYVFHKINALNIIAQLICIYNISRNTRDLIPSVNENDSFLLVLNHSRSKEYASNIANSALLKMIEKSISPVAISMYILYKIGFFEAMRD